MLKAMPHLEEQPTFNLHSAIEQRPFENPAVQSFFAKWCDINDSIVPETVSREDWEKKVSTSLLEKRGDGKQTLYIPEDLQLWEMVGVVEAVDHDTFADKPERKDEAKEKILELGYMLQDAGVYIAQRLDSILEGREIAGALAEEFYNYGQSLASGEKSEEPSSADDIAQEELTESETEAVDRFLAGKNLYESRRMRAEEDTLSEPDGEIDFFEEERLNTLSQFFKVSAKAFELERKNENGELKESKTPLKPWRNDTPFHAAFLKKIEEAMVREIETPKSELTNSIFRRGMELLQKNMPFDTLPGYIKHVFLHWLNGETTLREALGIDELKDELETVRKTGDIRKISLKEREVADKIQYAVNNFPYKGDANNPSEMIATGHINCVGASMLGGALMREVGLKYLVGSVPKHSVLLLVTSDGNIEWRDMLNMSLNKTLQDRDISGNKADRSPIDVSDIAAFNKTPTPEGLMFDLNKEYEKQIPWINESQRRYITVFEPEYGQRLQILNNTSGALIELGDHEKNPETKDAYYRQAILACREATRLAPKYSYTYYNLAMTLHRMGRDNEAVTEYRKATALHPKDAVLYTGLGNALSDVNQKIEAYNEAITLAPKYADPYLNLGDVFSKLERYDEAIKAYGKFIDLADEKEDAYWIQQAKKKILKLQNKNASA